MTQQDLATAIRQTLGDHPDTFDIEGIIEEIGSTYGYESRASTPFPATNTGRS
ncbi:hypothetical protein [Nonomuraea wenchangensis]|uniref:hypothetical protein n=1 Tax=Nonomuraea wenchangensis TaxID=568860 RepID=UPI0015A5A369|nr:hypothetical protein [Nonomuraea wenchangensis]